MHQFPLPRSTRCVRLASLSSRLYHNSTSCYSTLSLYPTLPHPRLACTSVNCSRPHLPATNAPKENWRCAERRSNYRIEDLLLIKLKHSHAWVHPPKSWLKRLENYRLT